MDTWSTGNKKRKKKTVLLSYPVSSEELEKDKFLEVHKQVFLLLLLLFSYIFLPSHQFLRRIENKEYLLS